MGVFNKLILDQDGLLVGKRQIDTSQDGVYFSGTGMFGSDLVVTGNTTFNGATSGATNVIEDSTTNGNRYILFTDKTSGGSSNTFVARSKIFFNPSTVKLNSTSFNSLSDISIKENIETLNNAIAKVLMMRGVSFTWKGTEEKSIGVVAQEVEKVIPEVVSTSEDGIKSVSYDSIIGLLIEAIKEQQQTIEQMKDSIKILSNKKNIRE